MSRFEKKVGDLKIEVWEPSPRWTRIYYQHNGDQVMLGGLREEELRDLQYLVNRAVAFIDSEEAEALLRQQNGRAQ